MYTDHLSQVPLPASQNDLLHMVLKLPITKDCRAIKIQSEKHSAWKISRKEMMPLSQHDQCGTFLIQMLIPHLHGFEMLAHIKEVLRSSTLGYSISYTFLIICIQDIKMQYCLLLQASVGGQQCQNRTWKANRRTSSVLAGRHRMVTPITYSLKSMVPSPF